MWGCLEFKWGPLKCHAIIKKITGITRDIFGLNVYVHIIKLKHQLYSLHRLQLHHGTITTPHVPPLQHVEKKLQPVRKNKMEKFS